MKRVSLIIILLIGLILFTYLLKLEIISDAAYVALISLTVLSAIIIPNLDRLKEFDLKNLRVVLSDIKKVSNEVKILGGEIVELIAINNLFQNRWGDEKTNNLRQQIYEKQLSKALTEFDRNILSDRISKYKKIFNEIDQIGSIRNDDPQKDDKLKRIAELNKELEITLKNHLDSLKH